MTSRSTPFVRAAGSALILLAVVSFPSTGWLQEQQATAPAAAQPAAGQPLGGPAAPESTQAPAAAGAKESAAEQPGKYVIRQGDTLWDIANAFYRDPFLWPLIWKSNPFIADPDLIYPGDTLVIPSLAPVERAISEPQEVAPIQEKAAEQAVPAEPETAQPQEEPAIPFAFRQRTLEGVVPEPEAPPTPGARFILPEETAIPLMDKYAMISAGFVSEEDSSDRLIGSVTDAAKSTLGYDDEVYISIKSRNEVNIGDRFLIYQPVHKVKHPITRRYFGKLYNVLGILKVTSATEKPGTYTARITLSFDAAEKGSLLTPYQEPVLIYPSKEKKAKNISGHILEVTDRRSINAQVNVVYLDKGKEDGVEPGDRFTVYTGAENPAKIPKAVGEVQVFLVKARTATAIVRKSTDTMTTGDRVESRN